LTVNPDTVEALIMSSVIVGMGAGVKQEICAAPAQSRAPRRVGRLSRGG
jgi:uncharacterized protein with FMN-binding domain